MVYGADDLAGDQMQTLAREFNLAETVFVLPPTGRRPPTGPGSSRPRRELPFAGHPSVGAAVTSMRRGLFGPGPVVQECGAGLLPITVTAAGLGHSHRRHAHARARRSTRRRCWPWSG